MFKISLKSYTLIEVVVAMVIIAVFTALFYSFVEKNERSINIEQKVVASIALNSLISETLNDSTFYNQDYTFENLIIRKQITYKNSNHLIKLKFTAFTLNNIKIKDKQIIVIDK